MKRLVLLSFLLLCSYITIAAEVNLDRILYEIPVGCSDEVIDHLRNLDQTEDILTELTMDTLTSACLKFKKPEESIKLMRSVINQIVKLEISEDADPNFVDMAYGIYSVTWFEPFFASGLIQEAENLFLENQRFFNQLKAEEKIQPHTELFGRHQFLLAHSEATNDKVYLVNGLRFLEATIPLNTVPFDKEHNLWLANLLFQVRVDLIATADELQDINLLVGNKYFR